jgi:hypothetical protein
MLADLGYSVLKVAGVRPSRIDAVGGSYEAPRGGAGDTLPAAEAYLLPSPASGRHSDPATSASSSEIASSPQ